MRPTSAYPEEIAWLRKWLLRGRPDVFAFQRPLARCDLQACRGMCCYAGVGVRRSTRAVIERLAVAEAPFFGELGLTLPSRPLIKKGWWFLSVHTTAVRPHPFRERVEAFPDHFRDTACVFMVEDGRCSLEVLSRRREVHPWHYKPPACWMQPIKLGTDPGISITLPTVATDPSRRPGYPGYVEASRCGCTCPNGATAAEVLRPELAYMQAVTGVNVLWAFDEPPRFPD